jgi:hypothetical protein
MMTPFEKLRQIRTRRISYEDLRHFGDRDAKSA